MAEAEAAMNSYAKEIASRKMRLSQYDKKLEDLKAERVSFALCRPMIGNAKSILR